MSVHAGKALIHDLAVKPAVQAMAALVLVAGVSLQLWRASDLLYVMKNDSRLSASAWLARHAKPGDTVEYFELPSDVLRGRIHKLPAVPDGVATHNAATLLLEPRALQQGAPEGQFVIVQGPDDMAWHWFCPAWMYERLRNGKLGYDLAADFPRTGRFSHDHLVLVSPQVQIYAKRERMDALGLNAISAPPPRFPRLN